MKLNMATQEAKGELVSALEHMTAARDAAEADAHRLQLQLKGFEKRSVQMQTYYFKICDSASARSVVDWCEIGG